MLVLSRHVGEKIVIGDNIVVSIQEIFGRKVKIGVLAPCEMLVLREELTGTERQEKGDEKS